MFRLYYRKTRKIICKVTSYKSLCEWLESNANREPCGYVVNDKPIDYDWFDYE